MAQDIQSDLGVTQTVMSPSNFHFVPVSHRRLSASPQTNRVILILKEESIKRSSWKYSDVKSNLKLSSAVNDSNVFMSPILKSKLTAPFTEASYCSNISEAGVRRFKKTKQT